MRWIEWKALLTGDGRSNISRDLLDVMEELSTFSSHHNRDPEYTDTNQDDHKHPGNKMYHFIYYCILEIIYSKQYISFQKEQIFFHYLVCVPSEIIFYYPFS